MPNCPNCGNGKLKKIDKGEYVYYCDYCLSEIDFANHTTIDIDKDRCLKAAYTHLKNENMEYALKMLDRLELEFPFDPQVIKLREIYDNICKKNQLKFSQEQNDYRHKQEQKDLIQKKDSVLRQITELEKDTFFWKQNDEFNGTFIDIKKLHHATSLLNEAEDYGIKCLTFRKSMWKLFEDLQSGRLKIHESEPLKHAKFYNMFALVGFICDDEDELEDAKNDMKSSKKEWFSEMTYRILFGAALCIVAIVLFFLNKGKIGSLFPIIICALTLIGVFLISSALLNIAVYQAPKSILKNYLSAVKEQENNDSLIRSDIKEVEQELKEAHELLDKLLDEFRDITILKQ